MNCLQRRMPLLVACSSTLRTPELEKELKDVGFKMFLEQPISNEKVYQLVQLLQIREQNIQEFDIKFNNNTNL